MRDHFASREEWYGVAFINSRGKGRVWIFTLRKATRYEHRFKVWIAASRSSSPSKYLLSAPFKAREINAMGVWDFHRSRIEKLYQQDLSDYLWPKCECLGPNLDDDEGFVLSISLRSNV